MKSMAGTGGEASAEPEVSETKVWTSAPGPSGAEGEGEEAGKGIETLSYLAFTIGSKEGHCPDTGVVARSNSSGQSREQL